MRTSLKALALAGALALGGAALAGPVAHAAADGPGPSQTIIVGNGNQVAGHDLYNAGRDNVSGSGDMAGGVTGGAPVTERTVQLRTGSSIGSGTLLLGEHTGDASFPRFLPANYIAVVTYATRSTAVFTLGGTDRYSVTLDPASPGGAYCTALVPDARCTVLPLGPDLVVEMN